MKNKLKKNLYEDFLCEATETKAETILHQIIYRLLLNDGHGNSYPKFAKRLKEDFYINIVPWGKEPGFTAAVEFDTNIIYVGEGFLVGWDPNSSKLPEIFCQLPVLIRHELCHTLMLHEVRMLKEIGDLPYSHIKYSKSLGNLQNIIMDFEISNEHYSEEDKKIIKHLWLNGELISGLITELQRPDWATMSLENMFHEMCKITDDIDRKVKNMMAQNVAEGGNEFNIDFNAFDTTLPDPENSNKRVNDSVVSGYIPGIACYRDIESESFIDEPLIDWLYGNTVARYPQIIKDLVWAVYNTFVVDENAATYTDDDLKDIMKDLARTDPTEEIDLTTPDGNVIAELYTPEEKGITIEMLKNIIEYRHEYDNYYHMVKAQLDDDKWSDDEIKNILSSIA